MEIDHAVDPEENTNILYRNTIQYLHDLAEKVPNTLSVLKSYYASKFRISELQTKISVEKSKNKSDARCPRCCLKLRDTQPSYFVKPEDKKSKFAQKVLKKVKADKELTKFQAQYLAKNDLKAGNRLVVTCHFCKKEISYRCNKPAKKRVNLNGSKYLDNQNKSKKKAKKKKDKFCGLQKEAVTSAQIQNIHQNKQVVNTQNGNQKKMQNDNKNHKINNGAVKDRIINNQVNRRRDRIKQKKNINKLYNILTENNVKSGSKSSLTSFLQSLSK